MLQCKALHPDAKLPTVSHPGEDLGYDLYAVEDSFLLPGQVITVKTGVSARFTDDEVESIFSGYSDYEEGKEPIEFVPVHNYGLVFRDRSSMAKLGITVSGGIIDSGYSGELKVMMTNHTSSTYMIMKGDKIVQMIPIQVSTAHSSKWVDELPESSRGDKGFGSSGK